jgi:hypothetical protein
MLLIFRRQKIEKNFLRKAGIVTLAASMALTFSVTGAAFASTTSVSEAKADYEAAQAAYEEALANYKEAKATKDSVYKDEESLVAYVKDLKDKAAEANTAAQKAKTEAQTQYYKDKQAYTNAQNDADAAKTTYDNLAKQESTLKEALEDAKDAEATAQKAVDINKMNISFYKTAYNDDHAYNYEQAAGTATDDSISAAYRDAIAYQKTLAAEEEAARKATDDAAAALRKALNKDSSYTIPDTEDPNWTDAQKALYKTYTQKKAYSDTVTRGLGETNSVVKTLAEVVVEPQKTTVQAFNQAQNGRLTENSDYAEKLTTAKNNTKQAQENYDAIATAKSDYEDKAAKAETALATMNASQKTFEDAAKAATAAANEATRTSNEYNTVKNNAVGLIAGTKVATANEMPSLYALNQKVNDAKTALDVAEHERDDAADVYNSLKSSSTKTVLKKLKRAKNFKVQAKGNSKVKVSWSKVKHAKYYKVQVQKKGSKSFKRYKTTKLSKTLKLKKGKTYKIKVFACANNYKNSTTKTKTVKVK